MSNQLHDILFTTTDASVWAREFCKINPTMDEGAMIGWFANAIETAKSIPRSDVTK